MEKDITIKEGKELIVRAEAFNAFNHTQFSGLNTTLNFNGIANHTQATSNMAVNPSTARSTGGFGAVSGARDPRRVQLTAKFVF